MPATLHRGGDLRVAAPDRDVGPPRRAIRGYALLRSTSGGVLIDTTTASAAPSAEEIGKSFATEWASKATEDEKRELLGQAPRIPPALDAQLIRRAQGVLGSISDDDRERIRRALRAGFWTALRAT